MPITLKRYRETRLADDLNDQLGSGAIQNAVSNSVTQEDYQTYYLSRLKQVLFGDASGSWVDDFQALEIPSLRDGYLDNALNTEPSAADTTYAFVLNGSNQVTQEVWTRVSPATQIKSVDYTYLTGLVSTQVTRVYALDGSTILAQATSTYSYASGYVSGIATTRDI